MRTDEDKGFERTLMASGELMRRGYSTIIKSCGKIIAALTAVVVVLVTFTEVGFYDIGARELTANAVLVLVASYIIYFSLEDAGEALGRESEEYRESAARLKALASKIDGGMVGELRKFLNDYSVSELEHRREAYLLTQGYSSKDLDCPREVTPADRRKKRAIRRAMRLRPIRISISALLCERGNSDRAEEIKSPEGKRILSLIIRLIPTTVCTLFTASIMLGVKDGLGVAQIIEGLVRLCPLPIVALRGYSAGYAYVTEREVEWIRIRSRLIDAFLKSKE